MTDETNDFAALFAASVTAKRLERGQTIEGTIVALGAEVAFVDVGGKGEATIDLAELKDETGALEVAVGDRVQAVVISTSGGLTLSRKLARRAATDRQLESAYRSGLPVEGKVERAVKGGYEVRIGRSRAFCPFSQIDVVRSEPPAHEGHVYEFRIVEYSEGGRNIVVSRRAVIEAKQLAEAAEIRRSIVAGAVLNGRVTSVREFGAFVDLGGGIQGLLHVSEMGWSRVDASEIVKPGDEITVKVLRVDDDQQKISLGLKQLTADPWSTIGERYAIGDVRDGRVTRIADFGAFVELEPGVEALAHSSTFPPSGRPNEWTALVPPGTTHAFEIVSIDAEKKRIGIVLLPEGSSRAGAQAPAERDIVAGARLTGKVQRHEPFGVFVFLGPGRVGLIPLSETGLGKEADVRKAFPVGADVEVAVAEVDPADKRIRLSIKALAEAREADEVRQYNEREAATPVEGLGSLGDKLRNALRSRDR
jgi:small subunit ribosomal protein S1